MPGRTARGSASGGSGPPFLRRSPTGTNQLSVARVPQLSAPDFLLHSLLFSLHTTDLRRQLCPVAMYPACIRTVASLIGVCTEIVSLCLRQVLRQLRSAIAVEVR